MTCFYRTVKKYEQNERVNFNNISIKKILPDKDADKEIDAHYEKGEIII